MENRTWRDKADEALLEARKNLLEHHVLLMTWKRLLWGCSGISLVFLCKDGLPIWQPRVQLGWAVNSLKCGVQRVRFWEMFPSLCYLFQPFLPGHYNMTSNKSKTAPKHLTTGLIFAESICNGFHYEWGGKKINRYIIRKKYKTNLVLTLLEIYPDKATRMFHRDRPEWNSCQNTASLKTCVSAAGQWLQFTSVELFHPDWTAARKTDLLQDTKSFMFLTFLQLPGTSRAYFSSSLLNRNSLRIIRCCAKTLTSLQRSHFTPADNSFKNQAGSIKILLKVSTDLIYNSNI